MAFSPCGIAMLPATIGLVLGQGGGDRRPPPQSRIAQGIGIGLSLGLGFSVVVALIAVLFGLLARPILRLLPAAMVALAISLVVLGILFALNRLSIGLPTQTLSESVRSWGVGPSGTFVAVGAAYGLAALSCTLPLFIALLAEVAGTGWEGTLAIILAFAVGESLVLTLVAVGTALWRLAMERAIRVVLPYVGRVSGIIVAGAGLWILYYWTLGPGRWRF
ncbi:MAG: hypothetical protein K6V73_12685 [Firmicutes bacterium]|nr:hypothetical protein [Bacillota bacterium]